jgi:hypothetical protein
MGRLRHRRQPHVTGHATAAILIFLVITVVLTTGCAFTRGNLGLAEKDQDISAIKKGITTRDEVLALLGAPNHILEINGQSIFHYYRYDLKHSTLLVFSRINIASDDLYVFITKEGTVDEVAFTRRSDQLKFQFWPFGQ